MQGEVKFYSDTHTYIYEGEAMRKRLISVNEAISKFIPPFNPEEVIDKFYDKWQSDPENKYYGKTREEIKNEWKKKSLDACKWGTFVHSEIEALFEGSKEGEFNQENDYHNLSEEVEAFKKWYNQQWETGWRLYGSEVLVYDAEVGLAGTVDLILQRKTENDTEYKIVDFKTNDPENRNKSAYEQFKPPINRPYTLEEKYFIQLNFYNHLFIPGEPLEKTILYLNGETYEEVSVPDRTREVLCIEKSVREEGQ